MPTINPNAGSKSYSVNMSLVAGDNLITHNLGLASPFTVAAFIKNNINGSQIVPTIKNETTNTCVLTLITSFSNASIKII
jgi:hypothetical protein